MTVFLILLIVIIQVMDIWTTLVAFKDGLHEANILEAFLQKYFPNAWPYLKVLPILVIALGFAWLQVSDLVYVFMILGSLGVVFWNAYQIFKTGKGF